MANRLAEQKLLQQDIESVDTALSAFEEGMFRQYEQHGDKDAAHDVTPENLRYLFAIFS